MTQASPLATTLPMDANAAATAAAPRAAPAPLRVHSFGATDVGRKRTSNEDQFVTASLMRALWIEQSSVPQSPVRYGDNRGHVFLVADGMGGAAGGEKASALAVGAIEEFLLNALRWVLSLGAETETEALRDFKAALRSADASVYAASTHEPGLRGMGTTVTMAYSVDADLFIAHVGDSRCYVLRRGVLRRLTNDHTLVQQMVDGGVITPAEATDHQFRHVITNVVGGPTPGISVEVHRLRLESGDVVMLCTDGLHDMLTDDEVAQTMAANGDPQAACQELIRLANEKGGQDNVTVVVARYD